MGDNDTENEVFEDAVETIPVPSCMYLDTAMEDTMRGIHLFFNNKFDEAIAVMEPWSNQSMYHALGHGTLKFLQAMLTLEKEHIEGALKVLSNSVDLCGRFRKKNTIGESLEKLVKKTNYDLYTPEEAHAELCYAECLLLKAVLTFLEDETLISFVKGGLKIRACYYSYKECYQILKHRNWEKESQRIQFESGVRMGIGGFNLMISLLPSRIMKLLEFVGFSGNKEFGLSELSKGYSLQNTIRQSMSAIVLLSFYLFLCFVLGWSKKSDLEYVEEILREEGQKYPDGAFYLFFTGRWHLVQGRPYEAIKWYTKAWQSQKNWKPFHHLCYFELMWCHFQKCSWEEAAEFAGYLLEESRWSPTIYGYQKAACMCMVKHKLTDEQIQELDKLMEKLPSWKQKIAGKSFPLEKFCIKKSQRYCSQGNYLVLPAIEVFYAWNGFYMSGEKWPLFEEQYRLCVKAVEDLEKIQDRDSVTNFHDNYCLALFLKGVCLRHFDSPYQAEECLKMVIDFKNNIREDTYLVPYAMLELGLLLLTYGSIDDAKRTLKMARNNFKKYSLESRLHFRVHAALYEIKQIKKCQSVNVDSCQRSRSPSPDGIMGLTEEDEDEEMMNAMP